MFEYRRRAVVRAMRAQARVLPHWMRDCRMVHHQKFDRRSELFLLPDSTVGGFVSTADGFNYEQLGLGSIRDHYPPLPPALHFNLDGDQGEVVARTNVTPFRGPVDSHYDVPTYYNPVCRSGSMWTEFDLDEGHLTGRSKSEGLEYLHPLPKFAYCLEAVDIETNCSTCNVYLLGDLARSGNEIGSLKVRIIADMHDPDLGQQLNCLDRLPPIRDLYLEVLFASDNVIARLMTFLPRCEALHIKLCDGGLLDPVRMNWKSQAWRKLGRTKRPRFLFGKKFDMTPLLIAELVSKSNPNLQELDMSLALVPQDIVWPRRHNAIERASRRKQALCHGYVNACRQMRTKLPDLRMVAFWHPVIAIEGSETSLWERYTASRIGQLWVIDETVALLAFDKKIADLDL